MSNDALSSVFFHDFTHKDLMYSRGYISKEDSLVLKLFYGHLQRTWKKNNYIFIFAEKKGKKRQKKEITDPRIYFLGGNFY